MSAVTALLTGVVLPSFVFLCITAALYGCATAQAVSRRLHTTAARVRSCGICGGQSFSVHFGFPWQFSFQWLLYTHYLPSSWYNMLVSDRRTKWTPSHHTPREKKKDSTLPFHPFSHMSLQTQVPFSQKLNTIDAWHINNYTTVWEDTCFYMSDKSYDEKK
jgi:hypothetical protein